MKQSFSTPTITAFKNSPDRGRGLARDMRVRWALEEVGQKYDVKLVTFDEMKTADYQELQPFSQIPAFTQNDMTLFESGAILLHIADTHAGLLPKDPIARARAITWMFAALNTVEPPIMELSLAFVLEREKSWYAERKPMLEERVRKRLAQLTQVLNGEWLETEFSAGDILMVTVLRRLESSGLLEEFPKIKSYIARATERPAYMRAFQDQLDVYTKSMP